VKNLLLQSQQHVQRVSPGQHTPERASIFVQHHSVTHSAVAIRCRTTLYTTYSVSCKLIDKLDLHSSYLWSEGLKHHGCVVGFVATYIKNDWFHTNKGLQVQQVVELWAAAMTEHIQQYR
jgi:hypothetical protein